MPDLPTLTVTASQADRLLAAFGDAAAYRTWLKRALLVEVERRESRALDQAYAVDKAAAIETLRSQLPAPDPPVIEPLL